MGKLLIRLYISLAKNINYKLILSDKLYKDLANIAKSLKVLEINYKLRY